MSVGGNTREDPIEESRAYRSDHLQISNIDIERRAAGMMFLVGETISGRWKITAAVSPSAVSLSREQTETQ